MTEKKRSPARRLTQAERRAQSWQGLVTAAVETILEEGVSGATFVAIGARAGYHRSLVTQRFGAKRGLVDAVVEHLEEARARQVEESHVDELPGLQALLAYVDVYMQDLPTNRELRAYYMLLSSAVADRTELRSVFAATHERTRDRLEKLIRRGQADGSIRPEVDPRAASLMVGSLRFGVAMQLLVDPTLDVDPIRRTALNTLRASFAASVAWG